MKRLLLVLTMAMTLLSACYWWAVPDNIYPPSATETPDFFLTGTPSSPQPADLTAGTPLPSTSYQSSRYLNEAAGFTLDYPVAWTVNEMALGDRGSQTQFLSTPDLPNAEPLPEGATRVNATIYQWDPKHDLTAYAAHRKGAWEASGFTIVDEQQLVLDSGLPAVQFTVQTPDTSIIFLFAAIGDRYLEISGEGNLELVKEIAYTLRPISK